MELPGEDRAVTPCFDWERETECTLFECMSHTKMWLVIIIPRPSV